MRTSLRRLLVIAFVISSTHAQTNNIPPVRAPLPGNGPTLRESLADLKTAMDDLQNTRNLKRISLRSSANNTAAAHKALDDEILRLAQQQETLRSHVVRHLENLSGVGRLNQGPLGTNPGSGRGILGDIDTRTLSVEEFYDVLRAVEKGGMSIKPIDGNAVTIEGANITIHREPPKFTQNGVEVPFPGYGKETAIGMGKGNPHLDVLDNVKKGYGTLNPRALESEQALQDLGKMTTRNLRSAGVADETLARQAEMLKQGYSPEAAGIVRDGATDAQRLEDLRNFQNRCRDVTTEAIAKTQAASELKLNQMLDRLQKAETELAAAKSAAQSANTVADTQSLEAEINALRRELVVQQRGVCDATKALLAHNPEAAALLSSTVGKVERVVVEGQVMVRAANGTLYTERQLSELILAPLASRITAASGLRVCPEIHFCLLIVAASLLAAFGKPITSGATASRLAATKPISGHALTPPEVKGHDDLKQIAPLAKTVLEAIMGAERRAAQAKEKAHEALAKLEALLKDQPDIETKLVLAAPDKGQEGGNITIVATLENPPDKFTIQFSEDGERWVGPEDVEDIKLTGNRVTVTTSLNKPGFFTLHTRAIEPAGKEVLAEAKKEIAVEPKDPALKLPPKDPPRLPAPSPDEELKAALEEYKAAQAAYNAARKQSPPPRNIAEIAGRQQKAYRRYNELIQRRSQGP